MDHRLIQTRHTCAPSSENATGLRDDVTCCRSQLHLLGMPVELRFRIFYYALHPPFDGPRPLRELRHDDETHFDCTIINVILPREEGFREVIG